jgi:Zn-finger nucleic acid-binding protein
VRKILRCAKCERQYDVSRLKVGSRVWCLCGESLVVSALQGHESAVVRCSACGAPRQGDLPTCSYCGAEFTLFEQDRQTICPHCLTWISREAKFCHFCGGAIAPTAISLPASKLPCPACTEEVFLRHRKLPDLSLLECIRCGGIWLSCGELEILAHKAQSLPPGTWESLWPGRKQKAATSTPRKEKVTYRKCPVCGKLMHRRRHEAASVILDLCRDHGVWFDADELAAVVDALRFAPEATPGLLDRKGKQQKPPQRNDRHPCFPGDSLTSPWQERWTWIPALVALAARILIGMVKR